MDYRVDIEEEYNKSKSKYFRQSLFFSIILTLVITGDVLLVVLSSEDYLVQMIVASIITVLFSWFAIFYFTSIYPDINNRYRYFKGYDSGLKPTEEVEFLKKSDELVHINGLYVYPVYVRYFIGLECQDKVIFALDNNLSYEMGDKLTITTYQRILLEAEKHS